MADVPKFLESKTQGWVKCACSLHVSIQYLRHQGKYLDGQHEGIECRELKSHTKGEKRLIACICLLEIVKHN